MKRYKVLIAIPGWRGMHTDIYEVYSRLDVKTIVKAHEHIAKSVSIKEV